MGRHRRVDHWTPLGSFYATPTSTPPHSRAPSSPSQVTCRLRSRLFDRCHHRGRLLGLTWSVRKYRAYLDIYPRRRRRTWNQLIRRLVWAWSHQRSERDCVWRCRSSRYVTHSRFDVSRKLSLCPSLDLGSLDDNLTLPIISGGCLWGFFKCLKFLS